MSKTLHQYFLDNPYKQIRKWNHYFSIYEKYFQRFKDNSPTMIEIGVQAGGSLQMWKEYFGKDSRIIGIDINPQCKSHEEDGIEIFIGNQNDADLVDNIFQKYQSVDIVLDDGSHKMHDMKTSFNLIYPRMREDGVYIVEDTHTCYSALYGGGLKHKESFIEFAKEKIDELYGAYESELLTSFTRSTDFIAFYDSIIVFQRKKQGMRASMFSVGMSENSGMLDKKNVKY